MLSIERPAKPYIILKSLNQEKGIHIITPKDNKVITIGRGNGSALRLNDISVSRNHAEIILRDGHYFIEDCESKFGTLVKLTEKTKLTHNMVLQAGRYLYTFKEENYKYPKSYGFVKYD